MQLHDIIFAICHEAFHQAVVTEDNAGHFVNKGTARPRCDIIKVLNQARDDQTFTPFKTVALINLKKQEEKACIITYIYLYHHLD